MASRARNRRGLPGLIAMILALGMVLSACAGPGGGTPSKPQGTAEARKTLVIGATAPPATMDPTVNTGAAIRRPCSTTSTRPL